MTLLQVCPPHLSDVATLPWEIQKKVIFQQYYDDGDGDGDDNDDVVTVVVLPEICPARPSGVNLLRFRSKTYSACRTRNPSHLY